MDLITAVQSKFDQLAPQLFEEGRAQATVAVHRTLEGLAFDYADSLGLAFGVHGRSHPASKNPESEKRILVFSSKSSEWEGRDTQGGFLFDQAWLVFYNSRASAEQQGLISSCELAMEVEFDLYGERKEFSFLQDFRKLLVAKAPTKVFVFRSRTEDEREETTRMLRAEFTSFESTGHATESYLLCGWCSGAFSYAKLPE